MTFHFPSVGSVGRATSSCVARGTIEPSASLTSTISTVSALGSWNDDVFTGVTNDDSFLSGFTIEHTRASRKRTAVEISGRWAG